jgi:uncharacterized protein (TIGR02271 family)
MAEQNRSTVVGVFDDYATAERVKRELVNAGIPREDVQVHSNFATSGAGSSGTYDTDRPADEGGISGFFHRLFGTEHDDDERGHYAEAVRRGSAVVSVTASPEMVDQATRLMNDNGAVDIDHRVAAYRETGYERYDPNTAPYTSDEALRERERYANATDRRSVPVVEEELQVGKRAVRRGGVRVYSHVINQPVEEEVRLREERVRVERRKVDRPVSAQDEAALRDQSVEVTEVVEEPVVSKRRRVREEVVVGKETTERVEKVRDTVQRTEVKVEKLPGDRGPATKTSGYREEVRGDYDDDFRRDFESNYASSGMLYDDVRPAYDYGYRMASDPQYRGRNWADIEQTLRTDYERNNPNSAWDRMKGAVRYGWEKVTGKRHD